MNARAKFIVRELEKLYPHPQPALKHHDAYTLLVAVALSAQTTDARVNLVTPALFKKAPTPKKMATLTEAQILSFIKTCGLAPTKAKNLKKMALMLLEKHNGQVPSTFEELEELPGVGHKTASVVMTQWFDVPAFPVDTHIHRLAQRWKLSNGKSVEQTEEDLKKIFPIRYWKKLHLQMIYYGREHCTARGCDGTICLICKKLLTT